jgi:hypothetical protein
LGGALGAKHCGKPGLFFKFTTRYCGRKALFPMAVQIILAPEEALK